MHHATPNKIFTQLIPLYFLASFHNKKNDIPTLADLSLPVLLYIAFDYHHSLIYVFCLG